MEAGRRPRRELRQGRKTAAAAVEPGARLPLRKDAKKAPFLRRNGAFCMKKIPKAQHVSHPEILALTSCGLSAMGVCRAADCCFFWQFFLKNPQAIHAKISSPKNIIGQPVHRGTANALPCTPMLGLYDIRMSNPIARLMYPMNDPNKNVSIFIVPRRVQAAIYLMFFLLFVFLRAFSKKLS